MKIGRIGLVSLIVGLIILMNASSSHVSGIYTVTNDVLGENETQHYVILISPVGPANLSIGLHPTSNGNYPPGFHKYDLVNIPVHMEFYDPFNQTLAVQDVVTPYSFDVIFKTRGFYSVYVTNKGTENSTIPVSVEFERRNPQNIEADKYFLSIILTSLGAILLSIELTTKFISKQRKQQQPKNNYQKEAVSSTFVRILTFYVINRFFKRLFDRGLARLMFLNKNPFVFSKYSNY